MANKHSLMALLQSQVEMASPLLTHNTAVFSHITLTFDFIFFQLVIKAVEFFLIHYESLYIVFGNINVENILTSFVFFSSFFKSFEISRVYI